MALQANGTIRFSEISTELGYSATTRISLGNVDVRSLANVSSGTISISTLYGKSHSVPIVPTFSNGDFSGADFTYDSGNGLWTTTGWNIYSNAQVYLGGVSTIAGWPTPTDPTPTPYSSPGESPNTGMSFNFSLVTNDLPPSLTYPPVRVCRLYSDGSVAAPYGIVHGPYLVSTTGVSLGNGDTASFWWKAQGGSDAYDIFAYLVNITTGDTITLINETGSSTGASTPWAQVSKTINTGAGDVAGNYRFVFISGSYDFTGGQALGASLYITDIVITQV